MSLRFTESPAGSFDAVIIGAGFAGLSLGYFLCKLGLSVSIVDDSFNPWRASSVAQGVSTLKGILQSDQQLFERKMEGHRGFEAWLNELEVCAGSVRPNNVWRQEVGESFESLDDFKKDFGRIYRRDFIGAKNVHFKQDSHFASTAYPGDWWVHTDYLLKTLKKAFISLGGKIYEGKISLVKKLNLSLEVSAEDGFLLKGRSVSICAGVESLKLLNGFPLSLRPQFFAVGGSTFQGPAEIQDQLLVKKTTSLASVDGYSYWGSTSWDSQLLGDHDFNPVFSLIKEQEMGQVIFKNLTKRDFESRHQEIKILKGARIRTRSRVPMCEKIWDEGPLSVWINTGYYKSGMTLSWLYSKDLAAEIKKTFTAFESP